MTTKLSWGVQKGDVQFVDLVKAASKYKRFIRKGFLEYAVKISVGDIGNQGKYQHAI